MHVVTQVELDVHASNTRAFDNFRRRLYFDAFSTVHTNRIYVRFRFDPLSKAFSLKTLGALVWTEGLSASKCIRFKTKTP